MMSGPVPQDLEIPDLLYPETLIDIAELPLPELRLRWTEAWGLVPPPKISRIMLERSLAFKMRESAGGGLTAEQQARLDKLVTAYKRNPVPLRELRVKPGTRLLRTWQGTQYDVLVRQDGYEHKGKLYRSLSDIAKTITGTSWNGWRFFGINSTGKLVSA